MLDSGNTRLTIVEAYTASWIEIQVPIVYVQVGVVEAYTASWIEMIPTPILRIPIYCRGLYSLVD